MMTIKVAEVMLLEMLKEENQLKGESHEKM